MEKIYFIRHTEDDYKYLKYGLNPPLLCESKYKTARQATLMVPELSNNSGDIRFISSPKIRALDTAKIYKNIFDIYDIHSCIYEEPLVDEIKQGNFKILEKYLTQDGYYTPLTEAWRMFREAAELCDFNYRFGDFYRCSDNKTSNLMKEVFVSKGENQIEYTFRLYKFLLGLMQIDDRYTHMIITHSDIITRIKGLVSISNLTNNDFVVGKIMKVYEQLGIRKSTNPFGSISAFPLATLRKVADRLIKSELDYVLKLHDSYENKEN